MAGIFSLYWCHVFLSCHLFSNGEKCMNFKTWETVRLNIWKKALGKILKSTVHQNHTCALWWGGTHLRNKSLGAAFEMGAWDAQDAEEREKKQNRNILAHLVAITLYLARQGMSFKTDGRPPIARAFLKGRFALLHCACSCGNGVSLQLIVIDIKSLTLANSIYCVMCVIKCHEKASDVN